MKEVFNKCIDKTNYYEVIVDNSDSRFKIDIEYLELLKKCRWISEKHIKNNNIFEYLTTCTLDDKNIYFHKEIMKNEIYKYKLEHEYDKQIIVDHINGDTTDNRKQNLRVRTQSENNMNKTIQCNNTSGIVGVSWDKNAKMWVSHIAINKKRIRFGSFYYLRNAVKSRIKAEEKYFGEHAFINRDENYKKFIKEILDLPNKIEPYIWSITYGEVAQSYTVVICCHSKKIRINFPKIKTIELAQNFINNYIQTNPNNIYIEKSQKLLKEI
jgi:hypothetical protein